MLQLIPGATGLRCGRLFALVLCATLAICAFPAAGQESSAGADISAAEGHFRLGVSLYKDGNYREALDEFRRALALEPDMEKASDYAQKAEAQLNLSAVGLDPTSTPSFETFDPESLGPLTESAQLSPEEHKVQRVRELVELGERYLEFQMYKRAQELFEQVLLIAPDNKRAREGFHRSTIGALRQDVSDVQRLNDEQHERIRAFIEEKKLLPEGADASGIKNYRISVPTIDERVEVERQKSHIEEVLESPVGVVFEDIHLRDILEFITDTYEINIVVDSRVLLPPEEEEEEDDGRGRPRQQQRAAGRGQNATADGMIDYINLKNVPLGDALSAILRPLELDYSIEPSFIWISTPEFIRRETFEPLEIRYYKLNYFGNETLYKVTLDLSSAVEGGSGGGSGGGGQGGDSSAGGGSITQGDVSTDPLFDSLEDLFDGFTNDTEVGETSSRFSGNVGRQGQLYAEGEGGLGPSSSLEGEPPSINLLRSLIYDVFEPGSEEILSYMFFQPLTNTLVVHNTPSHLRDFEAKLRELDKMPKQVSIESKFLTIDINDNEKVGFQYNGTVSNRPEKFGVDPNTLALGDTFLDREPNLNDPKSLLPFLPDGTRVFDDVVQDFDISSLLSPGPPGTFSLTGLIESGDDADFLNFTFDFLDQLGESEIMSAPRITTINQKPAFIADVRSEFFVTAIQSEASSSTGTGGDTTVTSLTEVIEPTEFIFGLTLSVTPHVNELNQVRLWLNPSVVSRVGASTFTQRLVIGGEVSENQLILPQRATQSVWTNVIVEDGDTIVLGGTVSDQTIRSEERMPYLSNIPVLGFFFRGKSAEISQTSLLIFVTPEIIDTTGARYFDSGF